MFYGREVYLKNATAVDLYQEVKDLPIIDYHCHISPQEIYEDKVFSNIGEMWLAADHYKWRLMRAANVDEKYITGDASYEQKFKQFAFAIELGASNPLYAWVHFELKKYFGIDKPLCSESAAEIWAEANKVIAEKQLSPRKIIEMSNVAYIGTTDDVISDLKWHQLIKQDTSFKTKVGPSFRTDNLILVNTPNYLDYIKTLSDVSGIAVTDLGSLEKAIQNRIEFFVANDCKLTDVGIQMFPNAIGTKAEVEAIYKKVLGGQAIDDVEFNKFVGYMYLFLAKEYKKHDLIMQLHLGVKRNVNSFLFETVGADCGGDTVGVEVDPNSFALLLNEMNKVDGLPKTIVYTLSPVNYYALTTIAGSFRNVRLGAAWWFSDHKRGIELQINTCAELSAIGNFYGMLSDSRSFLSYTRHDYFRRILCNLVGEWVEDGEYAGGAQAIQLVKRISFENIAKETL